MFYKSEKCPLRVRSGICFSGFIFQYLSQGSTSKISFSTTFFEINFQIFNPSVKITPDLLFGIIFVFCFFAVSGKKIRNFNLKAKHNDKLGRNRKQKQLPEVETNG